MGGEVGEQVGVRCSRGSSIHGGSKGHVGFVAMSADHANCMVTLKVVLQLEPQRVVLGISAVAFI